MAYAQTDFVDRLDATTAALSLKGRQLVKYFPLAFIGLLFALKAASFRLYWVVMAVEDGPAEYSTSLAYLIASFLASAMLYRLHKQKKLGVVAGVVGLMAAAFFFVAMEEISWGQRIFEVTSPEFFQTHNNQGEITLHNFLTRYPLHMAYILVGLYGAFAWKHFPTKLKTRFPKVTQFLIPDRLLQGYFLPAALLYIYYDYVSPLLVNVMGWTVFQWQSSQYGWIIARDQEPIELLLSVGVMFFVASLFNRQTHGRLLE